MLNAEQLEGLDILKKYIKETEEKQDILGACSLSFMAGCHLAVIASLREEYIEGKGIRKKQFMNLIIEKFRASANLIEASANLIEELNQ